MKNTKEPVNEVTLSTGQKMYSVMAVADLLNVTPDMVRKYVQSGKIKAHRIGNKYWISETALKYFRGTHRTYMPKGEIL